VWAKDKVRCEGCKHPLHAPDQCDNDEDDRECLCNYGDTMSDIPTHSSQCQDGMRNLAREYLRRINGGTR